MKFLLMISLGLSLLFGAVDINTANAEELATLKKIGLKKAARIIKYRQVKCFESVDELREVKGIGKKIIKKNGDNITASECKK